VITYGERTCLLFVVNINERRLKGIALFNVIDNAHHQLRKQHCRPYPDRPVKCNFVTLYSLNTSQSNKILSAYSSTSRCSEPGDALACRWHCRDGGEHSRSSGLQEPHSALSHDTASSHTGESNIHPLRMDVRTLAGDAWGWVKKGRAPGAFDIAN